MKSIPVMKKQLCIAAIVCFFANPLIVNAVEIRQVKVQEKVILQIQWGRGKGELGEVPGRLEGTPGESINPIAVDSKGNIYVGDSVNNRVLKYDSNGNFMTEIILKSFDEWPYKNIPDIHIDDKDNLYIPLLRKEQIVKFGPNGKLISILDLSKAGVAEKNVHGVVQLNAKKTFNIKKIIVDKIGNVYVLGSEDNVLKFNSNGEIIQRWGPHASNAIRFLFVDALNNLYIWMPPKQDGSMFKRYDMAGKYLGIGLGIYDHIIEPFYLDLNGNVFGFTAFTDNVLGVYNHKDKTLLKLPLKEESLALERWTVDQRGNVYYTDSQPGAKFYVYKITIVPGNNEKNPNADN